MKRWCDDECAMSHKAKPASVTCSCFLLLSLQSVLLVAFAHRHTQHTFAWRQQHPEGSADETSMSDDTVPASTEDLPRSTKWYRRNGRCTRREKAAKEQYLSPQEEKGLATYVLRASKNGFPVSVKALRSMALVIRRRRSDQAHKMEEPEPPGKIWPQGFYRRNPTIKARRVKAMAWSRHDHSIYHKVVDWFSVIGKELASPAVLPENVYNMDETGILLSVLGSLKVLVDRDDLQNYRGAASQRTLITAIECISADGRSLDPLIIWPASITEARGRRTPLPDGTSLAAPPGTTTIP